MRFAFATYNELPTGNSDEFRLRDLLISKNHTVEFPIWDDSKVDWKNYDIVLPRSTWDYHTKLAKFLSWTKEVSKISHLVNSPEIINWNYDKRYIAELAKKGMAVVPTTLCLDLQSAFAKIKEIHKNHSAVVIKPTIAGTAYLTYKVQKTDGDQEEKIKKVLSHGPLIVQPYLKSVENAGEISLIFFNLKGPVYSHAVWKRPIDKDFRVQREYGGTEEECRPSQDLIEFGRQVFQFIPKGEWAYARVDILNWDQDPLLGELEMIEPQLFFRYGESAEALLMQALNVV